MKLLELIIKIVQPKTNYRYCSDYCKYLLLEDFLKFCLKILKYKKQGDLRKLD